MEYLIWRLPVALIVAILALSWMACWFAARLSRRKKAPPAEEKPDDLPITVVVSAEPVDPLAHTVEDEAAPALSSAPEYKPPLLVERDRSLRAVLGEAWSPARSGTFRLYQGRPIEKAESGGDEK